MNASTNILPLFILAVTKIVKQTFNINIQHIQIKAVVISILISITLGLIVNDLFVLLKETKEEVRYLND